MARYAGQNDFAYMEYTVQPPSIWERIGWWFQQLYENLFINPNTPIYLTIFYYVVLLAAIIAAVYFILRLRYGKGLMPNARRYASDGIGTPTGAYQEDYDSLLKDALDNGDYKLAVRYVYLKCLVALAHKKQIQLKDWKTPYDYEQELTGAATKPYKSLARLFEYVWYGDFEVTESTYEEGQQLLTEVERAA